MSFIGCLTLLLFFISAVVMIKFIVFLITLTLGGLLIVFGVILFVILIVYIISVLIHSI